MNGSLMLLNRATDTGGFQTPNYIVVPSSSCLSLSHSIRRSYLFLVGYGNYNEPTLSFHLRLLQWSIVLRLFAIGQTIEFHWDLPQEIAATRCWPCKNKHCVAYNVNKCGRCQHNKKPTKKWNSVRSEWTSERVPRKSHTAKQWTLASNAYAKCSGAQSECNEICSSVRHSNWPHVCTGRMFRSYQNCCNLSNRRSRYGKRWVSMEMGGLEQLPHLSYRSINTPKPAEQSLRLKKYSTKPNSTLYMAVSMPSWTRKTLYLLDIIRCWLVAVVFNQKTEYRNIKRYKNSPTNTHRTCTNIANGFSTTSMRHLCNTDRTIIMTSNVFSWRMHVCMEANNGPSLWTTLKAFGFIVVSFLFLLLFCFVVVHIKIHSDIQAYFVLLIKTWLHAFIYAFNERE